MENLPKKKKDPADNYSFKADFVYKSRNPYSEKLSVFDDFVMRDNQAEEFQGTWNSKVFKKMQNYVVRLEPATVISCMNIAKKSRG